MMPVPANLVKDRARALAFYTVARRRDEGGRAHCRAMCRCDTWEYDGSMWTRVADTGPSPRHSFGFAYSGKTSILFAGRDGSSTYRDTWQWNGTHWTERQDMGPSPRSALASGYDSTRDRMVIFGGVAGDGTTMLGDTWDGFERP